MIPLEVGKIYWKRESRSRENPNKYILILYYKQPKSVYRTDNKEEDYYHVLWLSGYNNQDGQTRTKEFLWPPSWTEFKGKR